MTPHIIGVFSIVGLFSLLVFWTVYPPPGDAQQVFTMINTLAAGTFGAGAGAVFGYYFGSSTGSKTKDAVLGAIAENNHPGGEADGRP